MRKSIKLEEQVYLDLERLMVSRETFSEVVARLISVYNTLKSVSDTLGPGHYLQDIKKYRENKGGQ